MTIRYQCLSCGSKLNIKEELAGSAGKCPKCKAEFTVPSASSAAREEAASSAAAPPPSSPKQRSPAKAKQTAKAHPAAAAENDDFDPVAFLMEEESTPSGAPAAAPLSDDEIPADLELEIGDDEPPRRRSRRRRVNLDSDDELELEMGSASESAGVMLSGASAGAARDLLTRTVEESRARASRIDEDEEREPSPVWEITRELAVRALPGIVGVLLVAFLLYKGIDSLMGSGMDLPELGYVSGTVTLDGKPLAGAHVTFNPVQREIDISERRKIRVRPSKGVTDENGYYELNYTQDISGVAIGDHYVSISKRDGARELAPSKYGPYSREKQTVTAGSQEIPFDLTSDARR